MQHDHTQTPQSAATPPWRRVGVVALVACVLVLAVIPLDMPIARSLSSPWGKGVQLGGDAKRELEFIQQFGAVTSVVIAGVCVLMLDARGKARAARLAITVVCNFLIMHGAKMFLGRPRPRVVLHDHVAQGWASPWEFTPPWQTYPLPRESEDGTLTYLTAHAWDVSKKISSDLWSMPSSHAGAAACLACVLATFYPRLRWLMVAIALIVGSARVLLGAHFASDVLAGWAVGYCSATIMLFATRNLGVQKNAASSKLHA